jgi:hypothetical protein
LGKYTQKQCKLIRKYVTAFHYLHIPQKLDTLAGLEPMISCSGGDTTEPRRQSTYATVKIIDRSFKNHCTDQHE